MLSSTARRRGFAATAEVTFAPSLEMDLGQCRDAWTSDGGRAPASPGAIWRRGPPRSNADRGEFGQSVLR